MVSRFILVGFWSGVPSRPFCSAPIMTVTAAVVTNPAPRARSCHLIHTGSRYSIRARWISHLTELCNAPVLRLTCDHAHKRRTCVRTHKSQRNEHNKAPMIDKRRIIHNHYYEHHTTRGQQIYVSDEVTINAACFDFPPWSLFAGLRRSVLPSWGLSVHPARPVMHVSSRYT